MVSLELLPVPSYLEITTPEGGGNCAREFAIACLYKKLYSDVTNKKKTKISKVYSAPCETSMMELLCEKS